VERRLGVISDLRSGGTHTSRTIMLHDLTALLAAVDMDASRADYERAVLDDNVLSKRSDNTRLRSLRYLRELYVLDPMSPLFRGLRQLWDADYTAQPMLALVVALSRDPVLRATAPVILELSQGDTVTSTDLADATMQRYPDSYSKAVAAAIGRRIASSWTQSGHLQGRSAKVRVSPEAPPPSLVLALFIGHLTGAAGAGLFQTVYARALDRPAYSLYDHAFAATQRGWIDFRQAGEVVDVGFSWLMREPDAGAA
jgi:hypothetical protein